MALTAIPSVQRWIGGFAAELLEDRTGTRVSVNRVRIGLPGRIIVDGLHIYDQRDTLMLHVPRVAAKIDIMPLLNKRICISNAQLFGAKAVLYQATADCAPNWQFLIDAFKNPSDTTSSPINLKLGSLLVRRCQLKYDKLYKPHTHAGFDANHIMLSGISITVRLASVTHDSLAINVRKFSFAEQSGLIVDKLQFQLKACRDSLSLENFNLQTPHSSISIPTLEARYPGLPQKGTEPSLWADSVETEGSITLNVTPADFSPFAAQLSHMSTPISLSSQVELRRGGRLTLSGMQTEADKGNMLYAVSDITAKYIFHTPIATISLHKLNATHALWEQLPTIFPSSAKRLAGYLKPLGDVHASGTIFYSTHMTRADLYATTDAGNINIKGSVENKNAYQAKIELKDVRPGVFTEHATATIPQELTASAAIHGLIHGPEGRASAEVSGNIEHILYQQHAYHNIPFEASMSGHRYNFSTRINDEQGRLALAVQAFLPPHEKKQITIDGNADQFSPSALHLTKAFPQEYFSGQIQADLSLPTSGQPTGSVILNSVSMDSPDKGSLQIGDIAITSSCEEGLQHATLNSNFAQLEAHGSFRWQDLPHAALLLTHKHLPSIIPAPRMQGRGADTDINFTLHMQDTAVVSRLTGITFSIPEEASVHGYIHSGVNLMELDAQVPMLRLGTEELHNAALRLECTQQNIQASIRTQRMMKAKPIDIDLTAYTENDRLATQLQWDNKALPHQYGALSLAAQFLKDIDGNNTISARINPSDIVISDTIWKVHPGTIQWHHGMADIQDVSLSNQDRFFALNGKVSASDADTLAVDVKDFDLSYLFNIVNFHAVDFHGYATGRIYGRSLMKTPQADAFLQVHDFTFNDAGMGDMDVHINWGNRPKTIQLDAYIQEPREHQQTTVQGSITLGHEPGSGLDLDINTRRMNLKFLHRYASSIFDRMEGRITGDCRVFGAFKNINLQGKVVADEASVRVASLGVDYHLAGDTVILKPDTILFPHATIYDYLGTRGVSEHAAKLSGTLTHRHLSQMSYDVHVDANNILGYNFPKMGDLNFCGTVFATGQAHIYGRPGAVNIDVKATPQSGTTLVYDATSPATVTDTDFITYVSRRDSTHGKQHEDKEPEPVALSSDMYLNFDLDITPEATMQVLMDTKSGDYINLYGNGRILANYYNKGKFQMYGTYRVDHGTYKLSIQDVIRKDFTFKPGGTVTFGGDPGKAALQLKAVYTVPNVSLDDLSSSSLGLANTRVDCIMNIGGETFSPMVTFDFDLPNANEDEKQMVRSMISTDEERNMQVIYLLGIGRFYNQNTQFQNGASQGGTAMNSLISSTLSSQFNQFLSNAMGSHNWSFGANLRTGDTGWDQLDIEGILSGKLLNNRLLINGNFGYRESYYSTNNFIGDFDVQYLLTANGNLSLKAYNQTNDRYFIQSSLTTQGIGLQFKRDFNNWRYLFRRTRKSKSAKTNTPYTGKDEEE